MKLNRGMQKQVLEALRESYPLSVETASLPGSSEEGFQANLHYLREVGLIEGASDVSKGADVIMARVTARGLDFLQDDGGIEAMLGKRTKSGRTSTRGKRKR